MGRAQAGRVPVGDPGGADEGHRDHRVPLSDAAMAVLEKQEAIRSNDYVFAAGRGTGHAGKQTLARVLKRLLLSAK